MAISATDRPLESVGTSGGSAPTREVFWNLPNSITMLRIGIVPMLLLLPWFPTPDGSWVIGWLFVIAALTDLVDGWLARRGQMVTSIGMLLDPLADKLLVSTALIVLLSIGRIPGWAVWMVVVIIGRELAVTGLRGIAVSGGQVMAAGKLGKWKAVIQNISIILLIAHYPENLLGLPVHVLGLFALFGATALTIYSGYAYFADFFGNVTAPADEETP